MRFEIPKESDKFEVIDSEFEAELKALKKFEIKDSYIEFDNLVIFINSNDNFEILKSLKEFGYDILSDLSGIDFIDEKEAICVFYQLLSTKLKKRMRVKCFVKNGEFLQSVTKLFKSANWSERELYDMFGVLIKNHPNLKRILMPDDWFGYPLLKSYPLQGDEKAKWYEIDKIFGRENRDKFKGENRDSAFVDSKDYFNFAKLYHESEYGNPPNDKASMQEYQEDDGVPLVKKAKMQKFKTIKKRR